jgi:predicted GNAT superfamily acetyltransferase
MDAWVAQSRLDAASAAASAGVEVSDAVSIDDLLEIEALLNDTWRRPRGTEVSLGWLRALNGSGNYVAMARSADGSLMGTCVGFFSAPGARMLHSHLAAVAPAARSRGIGLALKLHQREWARERGATTVAWTFDPLQRRNLVFNLVKLAAVPTAFLWDHYGASADPMNAGFPTDRLLVHWPVSVSGAAAVTPFAADLPRTLTEGADGTPVVTPSTAPVVLVGTPADIVGLRHGAPDVARAWREALGECLGRALNDGAQVLGGTRAGDIVVRRT